jgi:hypothetical protein
LLPAEEKSWCDIITPSDPYKYVKEKQKIKYCCTVRKCFVKEDLIKTLGALVSLVLVVYLYRSVLIFLAEKNSFMFANEITKA